MEANGNGIRRMLVSAGPTRERFDAVRFWSNRSTGMMGYALAEAGRDAGYSVTLVSGPVTLEPPAGVAVVRVESAAEMADEIRRYAPRMDVIIMAAAVADYRPARTVDGKMKKTPGRLVLELERTEDILATLGASKRHGQVLVGFAAETEHLLENAGEKLRRKNLDWIVANDVGRGDRGFGSPDNEVVMLGRGGERFDFVLAPKREIARRVVAVLSGGSGSE